MSQLAMTAVELCNKHYLPLNLMRVHCIVSSYGAPDEGD